MTVQEVIDALKNIADIHGPEISVIRSGPNYLHDVTTVGTIATVPVLNPFGVAALKKAETLDEQSSANVAIWIG